MKQVGIVTITDNNNYGNRLQNYAVQEILTDMGYNAKTIWYEDADTIKKIAKRCIKKILPIRSKWRRQSRFKKFSDRYIKKYNSGYDKQLLNKFDYIVIGSDQIWNLKWQLGKNEFLIGSNKNNVIAFSPSFGVSKIIEEQREYYRKIITDIPYLSVREDRGKEMIKEITRKR